MVTERGWHEQMNDPTDEQDLRAPASDGALDEARRSHGKRDRRELGEDGTSLVTSKREDGPAVGLINHQGGRFGSGEVSGCPSLSLRQQRRWGDKQ